MSRRRSGSQSSRGSYPPRELRQVIGGLLPRAGLPVLPKDLRERWTLRLLVTCAVLLAWQPAGATTLADRFDAARGQLVAMYPGRRRPGRTYAGFVAALARVSGALLALVVAALRGKVREAAAAGGCWTLAGGGGGGGGWSVFGVDGTKVDCPMTAANEQAFGLASRKKSWPQQLLTVLFHVGSGLPWAFARGGARAGERSHLPGMLGALPGNAMLLADAGFTGYDLLAAVLAGGRSFVIRVGANVRLLTRLGYAVREYDGGIVYLWPADKQRKRVPPLVLRLVTVNDGRRAVHLLSSVPDARELGDAAVAALYRRRWGVELLFRALKQTLGRRKLLSDGPAHARVELDWSVVGLWVLELAHACAAGAGARRSTASALRAVRRAAAAGAAGRCGARWPRRCSTATRAGTRRRRGTAAQETRAATRRPASAHGHARGSAVGAGD